MKRSVTSRHHRRPGHLLKDEVICVIHNNGCSLLIDGRYRREWRLQQDVIIFC